MCVCVYVTFHNVTDHYYLYYFYNVNLIMFWRLVFCKCILFYAFVQKPEVGFVFESLMLTKAVFYLIKNTNFIIY